MPTDLFFRKRATLVLFAPNTAIMILPLRTPGYTDLAWSNTAALILVARNKATLVLVAPNKATLIPLTITAPMCLIVAPFIAASRRLQFMAD